MQAEYAYLIAKRYRRTEPQPDRNLLHLRAQIIAAAYKGYSSYFYKGWYSQTALDQIVKDGFRVSKMVGLTDGGVTISWEPLSKSTATY